MESRNPGLDDMEEVWRTTEHRKDGRDAQDGKHRPDELKHSIDD